MTDSKNAQLHALHEQRREKTIKKIRDAVHAIQSTGGLVTKKGLLEETGLSSGTFSQEYVKAVLKELQVCQYRDQRVIHQEKTEKLKSKEIKILINELKRVKAQVETLLAQNDLLKSKNDEKAKAIVELNDTIKRLRGQNQMLLEQLVNEGVPANIIEMPKR